jgi:hypothetical protein
MTRVRMLELSLRCFGLSLIALIPVLGLGPAFISLYYFMQVRVRSGAMWNAASPYLLTGVILSGIGLFLSLVAVGTVMYGLALSFT